MQLLFQNFQKYLAVEGYVLTGVSHHIEVVDKHSRMACTIGRQENCVKDLERMNEASVKSHDTEDQEVLIAWTTFLERG